MFILFTLFFFFNFIILYSRDTSDIYGAMFQKKGQTSCEE